MQLVKQTNISEWAVTNDEKTLLNVIYVGKPISQLNDKEKEPLLNAIGYWWFSVGISRQCSAEELISISMFLIENYGFLHVAELEFAIKLSLTGKLNLEKEQLQPYGSLSFLYIGTIINAYLDFKRGVFKAVSERRDKAEQKKYDAHPAITTDERAENMKDIVLNCYTSWKENGEVIDYFSLVYNYLLKIGELKLPTETLTELREKAKSKAEAKKKSEQLGLFETGLSEQQLYTMIGKALCVEYVFQKIQDIGKFIEKIKPEHFA